MKKEDWEDYNITKIKSTLTFTSSSVTHENKITTQQQQQ